ncbi:ScyD/ScyE family protein [Aestuariivivens sediminicola]|uniref:ScyD/ScyE family protein n=1 Tax=Aestuariivivens sediminicola TaxID=2913560 RepID=UPI001F59B84A|nr:ScyD/ScyE family protein [Aestuariivivens sediminicola]
MKNLKKLFLRNPKWNHVQDLCLKVVLLLFFIMYSCSNEKLDQPDWTNGSSVSKPVHNSIKTPGPPQLMASLPGMAMGSAIGMDGDLFVTQTGASGSILRFDKKTGEMSTFVSGLPGSVVPIGGVVDVAFMDDTAYALVTLVGSFFGDDHVNGIYRIDGPDSYTVIADIGEFTLNNPPTGFDYFLPTGLQFAMQTYRGGFLVTDGHHNRVYHVTLDGEVSEFKVFDNIVPTGLEVSGNTVYMTEAGTSDQFHENSKIVSINSKSKNVSDLAWGAPLIVDVEFNRGRTLFAISQGQWAGEAEGDAALPYTGALVMVNNDGTLTTIADGLDRPTSLEFIQNTAYIVLLPGEIWAVENAAGPPFGG